MAEVWLAEQVGPRDFVRRTVLKRIHAHLADDQKFVRAFEDEARLAARLQHPNIVRIEDFGEDAGSLFLVMEYVGRWDLRSLVNQAQGAGFPLPVNLVLQLGAQIADALHYAHHFCDEQGAPLQIVHRDVSPQNIMLTDAGQAKLLDFGIAKAASNRDKTRTGMLKGKLAYLSPEQATGEPVDGRTDQYALGIVLYELLARARLFAADSEISTFRKVSAAEVPNLHNLCPELPLSVADTISKALQRRPEDRYPDARAFARKLEALTPTVGGAFGPDHFAQFIRRLESSDSLPDALPYLSETRVSRALSKVPEVNTDEVNTLFRDVGDMSRTEPDLSSVPEDPIAREARVAPLQTQTGESRLETATLHVDGMREVHDHINHQETVMMDREEPITEALPQQAPLAPSSPSPRPVHHPPPPTQKQTAAWIYPAFFILLLLGIIFLLMRPNDQGIPVRVPAVGTEKVLPPKAKPVVVKSPTISPAKPVDLSAQNKAKDQTKHANKTGRQQGQPRASAKPKPEKNLSRRSPAPLKRSSPAPKPAPKNTARSRSLSKDDLDAPLFKHFQQILECQTRHQGAGIKVKIRLKIQPSGRPGILGIKGAKGAYAGCLEETISSWRWPRFGGNPQPHTITF